MAEVTKFLTVGGVATLVALVLFNLLVHGFKTMDHPPLNDHPLIAYLIANVVGMLISYRGTRSWAFRDREPVHADGGRTAYFLITALTLTLPLAALKISRDVLHLTDPVSDNISANVIGLALGVLARFYLFRTYVFRRPATEGATLLQPYVTMMHDLEEEAGLTARSEKSD